MWQTSNSNNRPSAWSIAIAFLVALCVVAASPPPAQADLFQFSYSDSASNAANGTLVTSDLGGGSFLATSGILTVTGTYAGTYSLVAGGPSTFLIPGFIVNNVLYPASDPVLDIYGLAFVSGNTYLNIWGNSPGNYSFYTYDASVGSYGAQFTGGAATTLTAIPEPVSLALAFVPGSLLLLALRMRRSKLIKPGRVTGL